ncbi:MAG: FG-GAP-like repeat-containing protein, partial [Gammaproteobacteria bacterium]|nr:FG-GAP-like repeat-containing protein [Gammaproteobacteria bacterium]
DDRFCLDGQRLILLSGEHGKNGSTYRTVVESFQEVTALGGTQYGPAKFLVRDKAGLIREYGYTDDAETPLIWAVNKISDRFGNYIAFTYDETNLGEHRPVEIVYGNALGAVVGKVTFSYATRSDQSHGYVVNKETHASKRLTAIQTYSFNTLVRKYNLSYTQGAKTGRSLLTSVQECTATDTCLPPTTFTWQQGSNGFIGLYDTGISTNFDLYRFLDFNGDGRLDTIHSETSQTQTDKVIQLRAGGSNTSFNTSFTEHVIERSQIYPFDYNDDGLDDILIPQISTADTTTGSWQVRASNGSTLVNSSAHLGLNSYNEGDLPLFLDMDSNGYQDIVIVRNRQGDKNVRVYLNSGGTTPTFSTSDDLYFDMTTNDSRPVGGSLVLPARILSNGKPSLLYFVCNDVSADPDGGGPAPMQCIADVRHLTVDDSLGANRLVSKQLHHLTSISERIDLTDVYAYVLDMNGDGLSDLIYRALGEWYVSHGSGTGLKKRGSTNLTVSETRAKHVRVMDYNADGRDDFIAAGGTDWVLYKSNGDDNFTTQTLTGIATGDDDQKDSTFIADLNYDGLADIAFVSSTGLKTLRQHAQRHPQPDLLVDIIRGDGGNTTPRVHDRTRISYVPITDKVFYTGNTPFITTRIRQSVKGPMYVVSKFAADAGTGGDVESDNQIVTTYHYEDGRIDKTRGSFLGFDEVRSYNHNTQVLTLNRHRLTFPYTGMIEEAEQYVVPDGVPV